jgi:hypothetical protein
MQQRRLKQSFEHVMETGLADGAVSLRKHDGPSTSTLCLIRISAAAVAAGIPGPTSATGQSVAVLRATGFRMMWEC